VTSTGPRREADHEELSASSYPRLSARTQRFTLGRPRSFAVAENGERVVFLRSLSGTDSVTCLWVFDIASGQERLVADPRALGEADRELTNVERARRERAREMAAGITTYATDRDATFATFALGGVLGVTDLRTGATTLVESAGSVADPRPAPDGSDRVAFVRDTHLVVTNRAGSTLHEIRGPDGTTCGITDFIAAEELGRMRGFWWAPDASALLAAVVDSSPVQTWFISDPATPERAPAEHRYPAAGTPNAVVTLLLAPLGSPAMPVTGWDTATFPYLVGVNWTRAGAIAIMLTRDQRTEQVLRIDPVTGSTRVLSTRTSDAWIDVVGGLPHLADDGRLLHADETGTRRRVAIDGVPITPDTLHVAGVRHVADGAALVIGSEDDPAVQHLFAVQLPGDGKAAEIRRLTTESGIHDATVGGAVVLETSTSWHRHGGAPTVRRGGVTLAQLASYSVPPPLTPSVRIVRGGDRDLRVALVLPSDHTPGTRLPVLMDPYGGPHHAEVVAAQGMWLEPQWLANQGFAVVVADGRGTPGRDLGWEHAIGGDLATPALTDQVDALAFAAAHEPDLDVSRVAIRGWSFGGYLAALAVLRRPDVFHAAIAGAPVTDWRLYDTGYTERYLGTDPYGADAAAYARSSLIDDAPNLTRPLLLIHGLADDNVVAAHTLRLSAALLAAGKPHDVLPITGATHMAAADEVAENLLLLQVEWLRRALTR
jgi:dipeptidyl-peptidase-4